MVKRPLLEGRVQIAGYACRHQSHLSRAGATGRSNCGLAVFQGPRDFALATIVLQWLSLVISEIDFGSLRIVGLSRYMRSSRQTFPLSTLVDNYAGAPITLSAVVRRDSSGSLRLCCSHFTLIIRHDAGVFVDSSLLRLRVETEAHRFRLRLCLFLLRCALSPCTRLFYYLPSPAMHAHLQ